jgi:ankyrin repeat protein
MPTSQRNDHDKNQIIRRRTMKGKHEENLNDDEYVNLIECDAEKLAQWAHDSPLIDLNEPPPADNDAAASYASSIHSQNDTCCFVFDRPSREDDANDDNIRVQTPRGNDSDHDEDDLPANHDSKPAAVKRIKVADTVKDHAILEFNITAVYFGWIKHPGTKRWRALVKRFSDDRVNYRDWSDSICEHVKELLQHEGLTTFLVCRRSNNRIFDGETLCAHVDPATKQDILDKTKQRFLDDRKRRRIFPKRNKKPSAKGESGNNSSSFSESDGVFQPDSPPAMHLLNFDSVSTLARVESWPIVPNFSNTSPACQNQLQLPFLHQLDGGNSTSQRQLWDTISPRDVCFEWQGHPGTRKWREVVQSFSSNTKGYPEWHNEIANLVKEELDREGILLFLVFLNANGGPSVTISDGMWYRATPQEILDKTKEEFLRDRSQREEQPRGSKRGPPPDGGSSGNSSSWEDSSNWGDSFSGGGQHRAIGQSHSGASASLRGSETQGGGAGRRCQSSPSCKRSEEHDREGFESAKVYESNPTDRPRNDISRCQDTIPMAHVWPAVSYLTHSAVKQQNQLQIYSSQVEHVNLSSATSGFEGQPFYTISPRDVCFAWKNHPGTLAWRQKIEMFSTNTYDYPEWVDEVADLVKEQLDEDGVLFFHGTMQDGMGYRASQKEVLSKTKEQFLLDRQLLGYELFCAEQNSTGKLSTGESSINSSWDHVPTWESLPGWDGQQTGGKPSSNDFYPLPDSSYQTLTTEVGDPVDLLTGVLARFTIENDQGDDASVAPVVATLVEDESTHDLPSTTPQEVVDALPAQEKYYSEMHSKECGQQMSMPHTVRIFSEDHGNGCCYYSDDIGGWIFRPREKAATRRLPQVHQTRQSKYFKLEDTPLHVAGRTGDEIAVATLLQTHDDPNSLNNIGWTPLHEACCYGHATATALLLKHQANPNAKTNVGNTPIHEACLRGHEEVAALLIQSHSDLNAKNNNGDTPLQNACTLGYLAVVDLLLQHQANPNTGNKSGRTPLHEASLRGDDAIVDLLLRHEADANAQDNSLETPLHCASSGGHEAAATLLLQLQHHADPNSDNKFGDTPLYIASTRGHHAVVALLLHNKANPNAVNKSGRTSLHVASIRRDEALVALLLRHEADPNIQDELGQTPLHFACSGGQKAIVVLLLQHHADPKVENKLNCTPYQAAIQNRHHEVASLLLKHPSDIAKSKLMQGNKASSFHR